MPKPVVGTATIAGGSGVGLVLTAVHLVFYAARAMGETCAHYIAHTADGRQAAAKGGGSGRKAAAEKLCSMPFQGNIARCTQLHTGGCVELTGDLT